jgi:hypothetical protein
MGTLSAETRHLVEDVAFEVPHGKGRGELISQGRQLELQVNQLADAISRDVRYDVIVDAYKDYHTRWRRWASGLRTIDSRYVMRGVRRVDLTNDQIHELLWIPQVIDRQQIVHRAKALAGDVDQILIATSVRDLLGLPNAADVLSTARELAGLCEGFAQSAAGRSDLDDLLWDYRVLDVEWQTLQGHFKAINNIDLQQRLAAADQTAAALRESLGIRPISDFREAVRLAASVDNLADILQRDARHRMGMSARYSPQFRKLLIDSTSQFHDAAHEFHDSVVRHADDSRLRSQCAGLARLWEQMGGHFAKCTPEDRSVLRDTCHRIAPALAKLQVLYAY